MTTTAKEVYSDLLMECAREVFHAGYMSTDYNVSKQTYKARVRQAVQALNPSIPAILIEMAVDTIASQEMPDNDEDRLPFEP